MSLIASVQARYSAAILQQLTNADSPQSGSVNTTVLQLACDDAEADFEIHAGLDYDDTDIRHVMLATQGVMLFLAKYVYHMTGESEAQIKEWEESVRRYAATHARAWQAPSTGNVAIPTPEEAPTLTDFDRTRLIDVLPADFQVPLEPQ